MNFDLVVLVVAPSATADDVRQMADHCTGMKDRDGGLDQRTVSIYEELRTGFPDHPPYDP